jgi:predicted amidohydrolase
MNERKLRIAAAQINPALMDVEKNLYKIERYIEEAVLKENAKLVVFPECALTGYVLNFNEVKEVAETIPGQSTKKLEEFCKRLNVWIAVGLVEKSSKKYYNTAVLISPNGIEAKYRKTHLPHQGLDKFVNKGDLIQTIDTPIGKFGLAICYDIFFPETARVLTLMNVELLIVLANWAEGVEFYTNYLAQTRAVENHINLIAVNRVGEERGFKFYGESIIIDCFGKPLIKANKNEEMIVTAEVNLNEAHNKHIVRIPGIWEVNCIKDRRPELYKVICAI